MGPGQTTQSPDVSCKAHVTSQTLTFGVQLDEQGALARLVRSRAIVYDSTYQFEIFVYTPSNNHRNGKAAPGRPYISRPCYNDSESARLDEGRTV